MQHGWAGGGAVAAVADAGCGHGLEKADWLLAQQVDGAECMPPLHGITPESLTHGRRLSCLCGLPTPPGED